MPSLNLSLVLVSLIRKHLLADANYLFVTGISSKEYPYSGPLKPWRIVPLYRSWLSCHHSRIWLGWCPYEFDAGIGGEYPATSTRAVEESQVSKPRQTQHPSKSSSDPFYPHHILTSPCFAGSLNAHPSAFRLIGGCNYPDSDLYASFKYQLSQPKMSRPQYAVQFAIFACYLNASGRTSLLVVSSAAATFVSFNTGTPHNCATSQREESYAGKLPKALWRLYRPLSCSTM